MFSLPPSVSEYDRYLASSKTMAAAYLDPNLNHTPSSSTKTHLNSGMERSPGAMERVLKVFHYFESSSEPAIWASIIRHGDATDVWVSLFNIFKDFENAIHVSIPENVAQMLGCKVFIQCMMWVIQGKAFRVFAVFSREEKGCNLCIYLLANPFDTPPDFGMCPLLSFG